MGLRVSRRFLSSGPFASLAVVAGIGLGSGVGCASSPALRAAERGDFAALGRDVAAEEKLGKVRNDEATDLARAVAEWELADHTTPPNEQLARVREVRACARDVDGALSRRMKTRDAIGAEAAMARVESGAMSPGDARGYVSDPDDAWRAVGARGLVREGDDAVRQRAYADPAPAVRRAAMRAAVIAKDPRDVGALSEAARVDPEPIVRTDAVRALGAIGGEAVVSTFRDLWAVADEPLREDVAAAWASPGIWGVGGRDEVRLLLAEGRGPGAIEAAGAVFRGAIRDPAIDASAAALLARVIGKGSHRDRVHAIVVAPPPSVPAAAPVLAALREASKDDDVFVRVAALAHLVESPSDRAASIAALEALAGDKDRVAAAARARLALAGAHDLRIQAWVEADLSSREPSTRLGALGPLAALGRAARAAPLLGDADPSVRTRAACGLLLAARR
jgi:HEAT repeat protein